MSNGVNVMLDLETAGQSAGCRVLSIGAVVFGPSGLGAEFYAEVDPKVQPGLTVDHDTVAWWYKTDPIEAERLLEQTAGKLFLPHALEEFNEFLRRVTSAQTEPPQEALVWGNGAAFDNAVLSKAYKVTGVEQGWKFWNDRCYRTLKGLGRTVQLNRVGNHHNALDDAKSQAEHAVRLMQFLELWPKSKGGAR